MSLYDFVKKSDNPITGYHDFLVSEVRNKRSLNHVQIELTPLCNFSCPFCYARKTKKELEEKGERVLRFEDWKPIIGELADMNVFEIAFSGGECTLHPDFEKIYRYTYEKGLDIALITNGSNITDEILQMFCELPPRSISVTMYGSTPEKYQTVCGNAKFYNQVVENIKKLNDKNINILLQTTVNKENLEDLEAIGKFADSLGLPYQYNMELNNFRRCDGDIIVKNEANRKNFSEISGIVYQNSNSTTNNDSDEKNKYTPKIRPIVEKGMPCAAGRCSCVFNYKGEMQLCVTFDAKRIDTKGRKISDCWQELIEYADNVPCLVECQNCIHKLHCRACIAIHYNDTHEFGKPSPRLCYKKLYPENAKEIEEFYEKNGYVLLDMYKYE